MCFVYRFVMQEKTFWAHFTEGSSFMFCVLLNTGQTLNQSLAVQNVAFTDNFNLLPPSPFTFKNMFLHTVDDKVALQSGHSFFWPCSRKRWCFWKWWTGCHLSPAEFKWAAASKRELKMWRLVYIHTVLNTSDSQ